MLFIWLCVVGYVNMSLRSQFGIDCKSEINCIIILDIVFYFFLAREEFINLRLISSISQQILLGLYSIQLFR